MPDLGTSVMLIAKLGGRGSLAAFGAELKTPPPRLLPILSIVKPWTSEQPDIIRFRVAQTTVVVYKMQTLAAVAADAYSLLR